MATGCCGAMQMQGLLDLTEHRLQLARMLAITATPPFVYLILLLGSAAALARAGFQKSGRAQLVLGVLAALQVVAAWAALFLTYNGAISRGACLTGIFGFQIATLGNFVLLGAAFILLLFARERMVGILKSNLPFFGLYALVAVIAIATLLRSALLCTV